MISTFVLAFILLYNVPITTRAVENKTSLEVAVEQSDGVFSFDDGYEIPINDDYKILFVNGKIIKNANIITVNDTGMIPIRVVSEIFGLAFDWNETDKTITLNKDKKDELVFTLGSNILKTKREDIEINSEIEIYGDYTYVPIRFIFEYYNHDISYYDKNKKDTLGIITTTSNIIVEQKNKIPKQKIDSVAILSEAKIKLNALYDEFVESNIFYDNTESDNIISEILQQIKTDLDNTVYLGDVSKYMLFENSNRIIYDKDNKEFYFEVVKENNSYIYKLTPANCKIFMSKYFEG